MYLKINCISSVGVILISVMKIQAIIPFNEKISKIYTNSCSFKVPYTLNELIEILSDHNQEIIDVSE